jgi:ribosomal protein S1
MSLKKRKSDSNLMDTLLLQGEAKPIPKIGELVEGTVISMAKNEIQLDISGLTTGVVRGKEVYDESGEYSNIKMGDKVLATVLELENEQGQMELSFRYAGHQKAWQKLEELERSDVVVEAKVIDANKGGLMIKIGNVIGFMPVSQLTTEHYPRIEGGDKGRILQALKRFINNNLKVKVIDVNEAEEKLIVSEKAAWEEKQNKTMANYKVGDIIEGKITGVVDFGAFVEFDDNLEGLIHISELAWQRIDHPKQIVKVGNRVKVKIIAIDGSKISLSLKQLVDDPWKEVSKKYKIGQKVKGKVLKLNPFGAFVELDKDIHGLIHISELSDRQITNPNEAIKEGDSHDFIIISIDPEEHRLGLSLKKVRGEKKPTPETEAPAAMPVKEKIEETKPKAKEKSPIKTKKKTSAKEEKSKA